MTKTKNRAEWVQAWTREAKEMTRAYQCLAHKESFENLKAAIGGVIDSIEEIGDRMESEGIWTKEGPQ